MLPSFMNKRRLIEFTWELMPLFNQIGTVEGAVGNEVLVRLGEIGVLVPAEWVEAVEG